jgi:archaellum component FlaF (FlaF/FlaG flagellin family)
MRHFTKSQRGLSTVISGVIILVVTAILGAAVVSWSNGSFASSKIISTALYATSVNSLNEKLVVENVWFGSTTPKFLNITMYNVGSSGVTLTDIKIINSTKTLDFPIKNQKILSQKTNSTKISYVWSSGTPLSIIITTAGGSVITSNVSP